jgi:hypothetical protein
LAIPFLLELRVLQRIRAEQWLIFSVYGVPFNPERWCPLTTIASNASAARLRTHAAVDASVVRLRGIEMMPTSHVSRSQQKGARDHNTSQGIFKACA